MKAFFDSVRLVAHGDLRYPPLLPRGMQSHYRVFFVGAALGVA